VDKHRLADGTVVVGFELPAAVSAATVSVCGEFNGWQGQTHSLDRLSDGRFRTEIALPAGEKVRFRYLLDGQRWENDWAADDYVPNGLGSDDSVVDLTNPNGLPVLALAATASGGSTGVGISTGVGGTASEDAAAEDAGVPARRPGALRRWWQRITSHRRSAAVTDRAAEPAGSQA
jgi:hypothetical protein